jgi:type IV fimbrial biogenesis protein FimT
MKLARGFTAVELMVTVAVIAIVAALAAPNFNSMIQSSRLTAGANDLVAALQTARMEAIRYNARVDVCPSADGASCAGSDWRRFIVVLRKGGKTDVLRDVQMNGVNLSVIGSSNVTATAPNRIWFLADGFVRTGSETTPQQVAAVGVCTTKLAADNSRVVRVNVSRISVRKETHASCGAPSNQDPS